jgi:hypothetical protein
MNLLPFVIETHEIAAPEPTAKSERPKPGFAGLFEAQMERRRFEQLQVTAENTKEEIQQKPSNVSMSSLYLSLLLRLGGAAPHISTIDPNAASVLLESLKTFRSGARRLFSRDSDLFSMPQFPVTGFKEV